MSLLLFYLKKKGLGRDKQKDTKKREAKKRKGLQNENEYIYI